MRSVGVELKTLSDAISCMRNGRFAANQLAELLKFDVRYLVVCGEWWNQAGLVHTVQRGRVFPHPGKVGARGFRHWLTSIRRAGIHVVELATNVHQWIAAEFSWGRDPWDSHTSLRNADFTNAEPVTIEIERPAVRDSVARKMLRANPHLGWKRSLAAARLFGSIRHAVNAAEDEWVAVEGVGKGLARKIVASFDEQLRD